VFYCGIIRMVWRVSADAAIDAAIAGLLITQLDHPKGATPPAGIPIISTICIVEIFQRDGWLSFEGGKVLIYTNASRPVMVDDRILRMWILTLAQLGQE